MMLTLGLGLDIILAVLPSLTCKDLFMPMATVGQDVSMRLVVALHVPAEQAVSSEQGVDGLERAVGSFGVDWAAALVSQILE